MQGGGAESGVCEPLLSSRTLQQLGKGWPWAVSCPHSERNLGEVRSVEALEITRFSRYWDF